MSEILEIRDTCKTSSELFNSSAFGQYLNIYKKKFVKELKARKESEQKEFWLEQLRKLGNNDSNEALKVALDDLQIITDLDDWLQEVKLSDPVNVGLGSKDIAVNVVDADCV